MTLDQVGDDLGVGLRAEVVAVLDQLAAQLGVVLDDPVENDVDLAAAVAVGMGVLLGDPAVGRPAGVGEADRRLGLGDGDGAPRLVRSATAARRLARLPTARTDSIRPSSSRERPAES